MTPLANVPTLVLIGSGGAGTTTLLERLLAQRPPGATWAVLTNDRGTARITACGGVAVAAVGGCVCCTAQVALRIALTRLLREACPARLFIALDAGSHAPAALRTLRSPWLAPIVAIQAVVAVFAGAGLHAGPATAALLAACDVVCVDGDPRALGPLAAGKRVLDARHATLGTLQGTSVSEPR